MDFRVLNRYILVEPLEEEKMVGGLKVHKDTDRFVKSVVFAASDSTPIKKGEVVYFDSRAGKDITYDGKQFKVLRDEDIVIAS